MTSRLLATALVVAALSACSGGRDASDTAAVPDTGAAAAPAPTVSAANDSAAAATGALLDPNTATRDELAAVPGMTPQAADALVAGRPYADMVAADRALAAALPDTAARKQVYGRVFKRIDLNKATEAEMLLIPGVGKRMAHEFDEYRPYTDLARFRREIGKYVDQAEVARLERYVEIR